MRPSGPSLASGASALLRTPGPPLFIVRLAWLWPPPGSRPLAGGHQQAPLPALHHLLDEGGLWGGVRRSWPADPPRAVGTYCAQHGRGGKGLVGKGTLLSWGKGARKCAPLHTPSSPTGAGISAFQQVHYLSPSFLICVKEKIIIEIHVIRTSSKRAKLACQIPTCLETAG